MKEVSIDERLEQLLAPTRVQVPETPRLRHAQGEGGHLEILADDATKSVVRGGVGVGTVGHAPAGSKRSASGVTSLTPSCA